MPSSRRTSDPSFPSFLSSRNLYRDRFEWTVAPSEKARSPSTFINYFPINYSFSCSFYSVSLKGANPRISRSRLKRDLAQSRVEGSSSVTEMFDFANQLPERRQTSFRLVKVNESSCIRYLARSNSDDGVERRMAVVRLYATVYLAKSFNSATR